MKTSNGAIFAAMVVATLFLVIVTYYVFFSKSSSTPIENLAPPSQMVPLHEKIPLTSDLSREMMINETSKSRAQLETTVKIKRKHADFAEFIEIKTPVLNAPTNFVTAILAYAQKSVPTNGVCDKILASNFDFQSVDSPQNANYAPAANGWIPATKIINVDDLKSRDKWDSKETAFAGQKTFLYSDVPVSWKTTQRHRNLSDDDDGDDELEEKEEKHLFKNTIVVASVPSDLTFAEIEKNEFLSLSSFVSPALILKINKENALVYGQNISTPFDLSNAKTDIIDVQSYYHCDADSAGSLVGVSKIRLLTEPFKRLYVGSYAGIVYEKIGHLKSTLVRLESVVLNLISITPSTTFVVDASITIGVKSQLDLNNLSKALLARNEVLPENSPFEYEFRTRCRESGGGSLMTRFDTLKYRTLSAGNLKQLGQDANEVPSYWYQTIYVRLVDTRHKWHAPANIVNAKSAIVDFYDWVDFKMAPPKTKASLKAMRRTMSADHTGIFDFQNHDNMSMSNFDGDNESEYDVRSLGGVSTMTDDIMDDFLPQNFDLANIPGTVLGK